MARRYDVLVIDLDGTLLDRSGRVSEANRNAVLAARDAGMEIIIATGRALVESRTALEAIEHDGIVVAAGGSLLCESDTGRTLERHAMPEDLVRDVTQRLVAFGHKALILKDSHAAGYDYLAVGSGELDPASRWWFSKLPVKIRFVDTVDEDEHPEHSVRAGAVACGRELEPLAHALRCELGERCFLQHWSAVTETAAVGASTHLLEIFTPNVNKWSMVSAYCDRKGIAAERVAAIGDGLNDVELLQYAGLGIAMANSGPAVLAVADRVTRDHDADGVAAAIADILEERA